MQEEMPEQFAVVLAEITDVSVMQSFLRDVMTDAELRDISARFEAAKMLNDGIPYTQITKRTKLSSRTVARISDWLQNGTGGYRTVLDLTDHLHIQPDSSV